MTQRSRKWKRHRARSLQERATLLGAHGVQSAFTLRSSSSCTCMKLALPALRSQMATTTAAGGAQTQQVGGGHGHAANLQLRVL